MQKTHLFLATLLAGLLAFPAAAPAQQAGVPKNVVVLADGKFQPAPGYDWLTGDVKDLRVRWSPGQRHPVHPKALAANKEGDWLPAVGFRWASNNPKDLRVVRAGPTQDDIARAVLKSLGAVVLHQNSLPQPGDGFGEALARGFARNARDGLIDSALQDLSPQSTAVERTAVRHLVVLALEGRLDRNRDRVLDQLRRDNPNMADAVEVAEFLIRLAQAIDQGRR